MGTQGRKIRAVFHFTSVTWRQRFPLFINHGDLDLCDWEATRSRNRLARSSEGTISVLVLIVRPWSCHITSPIKLEFLIRRIPLLYPSRIDSKTMRCSACEPWWCSLAYLAGKYCSDGGYNPNGMITSARVDPIECIKTVLGRLARWSSG